MTHPLLQLMENLWSVRLVVIIQGRPQVGAGVISPPTPVICAPYFFTIWYILCNTAIKKVVYFAPTLADVPPTSKVADSPVSDY